MLNSTSPQIKSVILKLVGEYCNIDCHYCYEKRKPQSNQRFLSPETLDHFLKLLNNQPLVIELHGGEPLLFPKDKLISIFKVISSYPNKTKIRMQTNGTLLNDEWLDLFEKYSSNLELGISLDGDFISNSLRKDYKGRNTSLKVEKALHLLELRKWNVGIISVVTKECLSRTKENLDYLKQFSCIKMIKFAPCFDYSIKQVEGPRRSKFTIKLNQQTNSQAHSSWAITPLEFSDYLIEVWKYWKKAQLYSRFVLEPHLTIIRKLSNKEVSNCHFSYQKCDNVLTLYPDGRITSCDELPQDIANITNVYADTKIPLYPITDFNTQLSEEYNAVMQKCNSCSYQNTCGGGCIATRIRYKDTPYYEEYCEHRIKIIDFINEEILSLANI